MKEALTARGMTVARLAEMTGISKRTLDQYMTGRHSILRAWHAHVSKIADVLGIDPMDLTDPPDRQ